MLLVTRENRQHEGYNPPGGSSTSMETTHETPSTARPGLEPARETVGVQLVTDDGTVDVSLPRLYAATMGTALTEYAGQ